MTILQGHKYYWLRDGASKYMVELSQLLEQAGHTVIPFALMEHGKTLDSPYQEYFVESLDLSSPEQVSVATKIKTIGRMVYSHHARSQLSRLLDAHPIDIAHLHNIYHHISPSILVELKRRGVPIVMTLHDYKLIAPNYTVFHHGAVHEENTRGWYLSNIWQRSMKDSVLQSTVVTAEMIWHHKIMRYYERLVDHFISPSQFLINLCVQHGWDRSRFTHIPNPVVVPARTTYRDQGYVAYLGRLSEEKGIMTLLAAAIHLPNVQIRIAGHGPLEPLVRAFIEEHTLTNVELVGFLQGAALQAYTQEAAMIVVPSVWYENNPLAVLEACALGKVVIASNIGGLPEILPSEALVPASDPQALAARITQWIQAGEEQRAAFGSVLRTRVAADNDPTAHLAAVLGVYDNALNR